VPNPSSASRLDLQEVSNRHRHALRVVAGFSCETPAVGRAWQHIERCLSDVPVLISEIIRLRGEVDAGRLDWANLAAAARAALAAGGDSEPDSLWYLRDELAAQGLLGEHDATVVNPDVAQPGRR